MADKIWEDLIENYSYVDHRAERSEVANLNYRNSYVQRFNPFEESVHTTTTPTSNPTAMHSQANKEQSQLVHEEDTVTGDHLKFLKAVQLSQSFVLIIDRRGVIAYANPHFQKISGYTQDELLGREMGFLISDLASHEEYEQILQAIKAGVSWKGELVNSKKNGEWYIFTAKISPVTQADGSVVDYIVVGHDVTTFRETEIKLEQAVEEKTILLSELHHRVKNNLAIISGIMQLQAFDEGDENLKTKLFSSVGRVKTLANMHELLYETSSFSKLEFGKNVSKIVETVAEMFDKQRLLMEVNYELEPAILNINQAHPCALILNEVITNSYRKAADNPEIKGRLEIRLVSFGKKMMIELKDNLYSVPEGFSAKKQPLSLQLIRTLTRQINGHFNYLNDDNGTIFTLSFYKEHTKGSGNVRLS